MKKAIALTIALAMCLTALALPAAAADTVTAQPTASTVYINGTAVAFEAYTIAGSNYFKLRDLAYALNGTPKQFAVGYDEATKAVTLTSGGAYTAVGSEMAKGDGKAKTATPTPSRIYFNGKELNLTVYNIGGNNFFKLRDLMEVLNVFVGYDDATKAITLDTSKGYEQPGATTPPSTSDGESWIGRIGAHSRGACIVVDGVQKFVASTDKDGESWANVIDYLTAVGYEQLRRTGGSTVVPALNPGQFYTDDREITHNTYYVNINGNITVLKEREGRSNSFDQFPLSYLMELVKVDYWYNPLGHVYYFGTVPSEARVKKFEAIDLIGVWGNSSTSSYYYRDTGQFASTSFVADGYEFKADGTFHYGFVGSSQQTGTFHYFEDGKYSIIGNRLYLTGISASQIAAIGSHGTVREFSNSPQSDRTVALYLVEEINSANGQYRYKAYLVKSGENYTSGDLIYKN